MPSILLHLLPATLYTALGVRFWHSRWHAPALSSRPGLRPWERALLLLALLAGAFGYPALLFLAGPAADARYIFPSNVLCLTIALAGLGLILGRDLLGMACALLACLPLLPELRRTGLNFLEARGYLRVSRHSDGVPVGPA